MKTNQTFTSIDRNALDTVSGGAARVAATSRNSDLNSQLQMMMTSLADSIKSIKNDSGSDQMMPMMMMMMMMGGGGGGGGAAAAPPPVAAPPPPQGGTYVKVNVRR
jgi:hypothetical protein